MSDPHARVHPYMGSVEDFLTLPFVSSESRVSVLGHSVRTEYRTTDNGTVVSLSFPVMRAGWHR